MRKASKLVELFDTYEAVVFFDTETTGTDPAVNRIIELAALRIERNQDSTLFIESKMDDMILLPPGSTIPEEIEKLTGITNNRLKKDGIQEATAARKFRQMLRGKVLLVAHNAQFDISFARAMLGRTAAGEAALNSCDYLDSLTIYKDRAPYPHRLVNAIEHYGLQGKVKNSHRAIDDVMALYCVTYTMAEERADLAEYINIFGYNSRYGIIGDAEPKVKYYPQSFNDTIVDPDRILPAIIRDKELTGEQLTFDDIFQEGGQNHERNGNHHHGDNLQHTDPALSDQQDRQQTAGQRQEGQPVNQATCSRCGAPIKLIRMRSGKNMPCNTKQINYIIRPGADTKLVTLSGDVVSCEMVENPSEASGWGYTPHWASCPAADQFRRRGKSWAKNIPSLK